MKIGTGIRMEACTVVDKQPDGVDALWKYRAPKGEQFVFLIMGSEPSDGSAPLSVRDKLIEWGWTPPAEIADGGALSRPMLNASQVPGTPSNPAFKPEDPRDDQQLPDASGGR